MITLDPTDDALQGLVGVWAKPTTGRNRPYQIESVLSVGGMGTAFLARQIVSQGERTAVVKVLHPSLAREGGHLAAVAVQKEIVALQRLNGRVPPTPFVVRSLDHGSVPVNFGRDRVELPFLALEYVHGGPEGTTLSERVVASVRATGDAFGRARLVRLIDCLAEGIAAIHEVGVIHRDLKPDNILCCGYDEDEIFKISDFGIARPIGLAATFGNCAMGTPGYAPAEQYSVDLGNVGIWSDVFSLGCVLYYAATGEDFFQPASVGDAILQIRDSRRRPVAQGAHTAAEVRENAGLCHQIDLLLASATAYRHTERIPDPSMLLQPLRAALHVNTRRPTLSRRLASIAPGALDATRLGGWSWQVRHQQGGPSVIRSVAWNSDGRCLCATEDGLLFWDGASWYPLSPDGLPDPRGVRFVRRLSAGRWLLGGDGATLAVYDTNGVREVTQGADPTVAFELASGDWEDLAVVVATRPGEPPNLIGLTGRRWLRELRLDDVAHVSGLARVGDAQWLVSGRDRSGVGYLGLYEPLRWFIDRIPTPGVRSFLACAGDPQRELGVAVGTDGATAWLDMGHQTVAPEQGTLGLAAVALDESGRAWAATAGALWLRTGSREGWQQVWSDSAWRSPIVSVMAEVGRVFALTVDGGVIEGALRP